MLRSKLRPVLQLNIMLLVVGIAALTGWACSCFGSNYNKLSNHITTRDRVVAPNLVYRWHDAETQNVTASQKDLDYFKSWVQTGEVGFGILVPTAPGADRPGDLTGTPRLHVRYTPAGGEMAFFTVPLTVSAELAQKLEKASPAPQGMHWQALTVTGFDWLSDVPTQTVTMDELAGSLSYGIDFHGEDACNNCRMDLTGCSTKAFSLGEQAALMAMGLAQGPSDEGLTCAAPVTSILLYEDNQGQPLPGPFSLSLGLYGYTPYSTTTSSTYIFPIDVTHTDPTTRTVLLSPVYSEQGWNYTWTDLQGNPITQLEAGPLPAPLWEKFGPNVNVVGSNLPTCTRALDTIHMTATLAMTPTYQAFATTKVQVLPNPDICQVIDVGVFQVASTSAISAGQSVNYTWTITNFQDAPVNVIVTGTLSTAEAVGSTTLPANCTRSGAVINCQVANIPARETATLNIGVKTSVNFNGVFETLVQVDPAVGTDSRFYDNIDGPAAVTVSGGITQRKLFLPLVKRN